jgi:hypothetical protein
MCDDEWRSRFDDRVRPALARLGPDAGFELGREAQKAASALDDTVPFIAWIAEHNLPSRRVAERLGLICYGRGRPLRQPAPHGLRGSTNRWVQRIDERLTPPSPPTNQQ